MPYKNKDKTLIIGASYHAYNRGYDKKIVFRDKHDYRTFLYLLKKHLDPEFRVYVTLDTGVKKYLMPKKYNEDVELLAYCLMPNHFHLLLRLKKRLGMSMLMNMVLSSYTQYFNDKYSRVGGLWQSTYRAVLIRDENQYDTTIDYIHRNPIDLGKNIYTYEYSSLRKYLSRKNSKWLSKQGQPLKGQPL